MINLIKICTNFLIIVSKNFVAVHCGKKNT